VVIVLGRSVKTHQWFALLLLMGGTVMVQDPPKPKADGDTSSVGSLYLGIGATVVACLCSSFASVYLEKILTESKPSIWVRNAQLCIFTIPIAFAGTFMVTDPYMREDGSFLHGFNFVVWSAIFTNAAGGMIVAVVMKFAGNILRNFAQACAIIVVGFGSWLLFDFEITMSFVAGVSLVIGSIFIYGSSLEQLMEWKASAGRKFGFAGKSYEAVPLCEESVETTPSAKTDPDESGDSSPLSLQLKTFASSSTPSASKGL